MSREASGRRVSSEDGIDYIFSGLPVAFINVAILTRPSVFGIHSPIARTRYGPDGQLSS